MSFPVLPEILLQIVSVCRPADLARPFLDPRRYMYGKDYKYTNTPLKDNWFSGGKVGLFTQVRGAKGTTVNRCRDLLRPSLDYLAHNLTRPKPSKAGAADRRKLRDWP